MKGDVAEGGWMSELYLPGFTVNSCTTVIARWSATKGITRDLFQVGTL